MTTFSGNNELALHVSDPSAAEAFYTGTLGCIVVDRAPDCISPNLSIAAASISAGTARFSALRSSFVRAGRKPQ
jgi:catechol 2,3-dioxygenase-like lactoylglutathione lyase family enzyme